MGDNTTLNAGSGGDVIATDDISGVKHQLVKLEFGLADSATLVSSSNPLPVTGPLTDTQLRATAVPVSGTVTASGPLTDTQLRATAVPVSGTVTASGPLTDTQLRATAVPVSVASVPSHAVTVTSGNITADTELPAAAALGDGAPGTPTTPTIGAMGLLFNATNTVDRQRAVINGMNSDGTGVTAAGILGQLDDTGTSSVTEDSLGIVRISARRALLVEGVTSGTAVAVSGTDSVDAATFIAKTYDWTGAVTGGTVWQPASGKKFVLCDLVLSASGACTVTLFDGTDNTTLRVMKLNAVAGGGISFNYRKPYVSAAGNNILKITTSATGGFLTVSGYEI